MPYILAKDREPNSPVPRHVMLGRLNRGWDPERAKSEPVHIHKHKVASSRDLTPRTHTATWNSWNAMVRRCTRSTNSSFPTYGGKNIRVCDRWLGSYASFQEDMGIRPDGTTLDRYPDRDGPYDPRNCRWATPVEQNRNRASNRLLTHEGSTLCVSEWAKRIGVEEGTLKKRLDAGWSTQRTLTTPVRPKLPSPRKTFTHQGKTLSLPGWAKVTGVPLRILCSRLRQGWTFEAAVTRPLRPSHPRGRYKSSASVDGGA